VSFRRETKIEVLKYDIQKLLRDIKLTQNKILFSLNIEKIVKIIKENKTREDIKRKIIEAFKKHNLTDEDAEIIIETKLIQIKDLTALEDTLKKKEIELKKVE
jgi:DNA gyrase/topoisomerase IV subunit A